MDLDVVGLVHYCQIPHSAIEDHYLDVAFIFIRSCKRIILYHSFFSQ